MILRKKTTTSRGRGEGKVYGVERVVIYLRYRGAFSHAPNQSLPQLVSYIPEIYCARMQSSPLRLCPSGATR